MRALRIAAYIVLALATTVLVAAGTVRATVLDREFYDAALDGTHAYDRLYDFYRYGMETPYSFKNPPTSAALPTAAAPASSSSCSTTSSPVDRRAKTPAW